MQFFTKAGNAAVSSPSLVRPDGMGTVNEIGEEDDHPMPHQEAAYQHAGALCNPDEEGAEGEATTGATNGDEAPGGETRKALRTPRAPSQHELKRNMQSRTGRAGIGVMIALEGRPSPTDIVRTHTNPRYSSSSQWATCG